MEKSTLGSLLIALVMLLAGIGLIMLGRNASKKAKASQSWPTTQGVVVAVSIKATTDNDGNDTYTPIVRYRYEVNGKTYESQRLAFGGQTSFSNNFEAEDFLKSYQENAPVTVYYNPANPSEAVLDTSTSSGRSLIFLGGFFVFIGLALSVGYVAFWHWARRFEGT